MPQSFAVSRLSLPSGASAGDIRRQTGAGTMVVLMSGAAKEQEHDDEDLQHDRGSAAGSRRQAGDVHEHGMGRSAQPRRVARPAAAPARFAAVASGADAA